jgi:hypothetical protein
MRKRLDVTLHVACLSVVIIGTTVLVRAALSFVVEFSLYVQSIQFNTKCSFELGNKFLVA